ncbi:MAG: hypothetical protein ISS15_09720 [Alphaproteobacteria bacterium]|nr:hypothetical protein [Alphaproteobacteria bacterium]MBL6938718.1 hypothetical protein [Alphaproteobacteria bacterium]MBL7097925.1 hypothetical protein [Alphaproteobacteria bacterium]
MQALKAAVVALSLTTSVASASAEDVLIRSDLPLPIGSDQKEYPIPCNTDKSFGMCSRFALGDWKTQPAECGDPDCAFWTRLEIASVIDGGYAYGTANTQAALGGNFEPVAIIKLEPDRSSTLFAIQVGYRGGSTYILLSTPPRDGLIKNATVLEPRCMALPHVESRQRHEPLFLRTDYCAVNSMKALVAIARDAMNRAPAATMTWVADAPEKP